jgi:hypothetical protein
MTREQTFEPGNSVDTIGLAVDAISDVGLPMSINLSHRIHMLHCLLGGQAKKLQDTLSQNEKDILIVYQKISDERKLDELNRLKRAFYALHS